MGARDAPILVAVDFSPDSVAAFGWGVNTALRFDCPLVVVHIVHDPAASPGTYVQPAKPMAELEKTAEQMLSEHLEALKAKFPGTARLTSLRSRVVSGLPVGRILEVAAQEGAQLIVMGGQGRSGFADALLGSKVERVARLATLPVTIVRAQKTPDADEASK